MNVTLFHETLQPLAKEHCHSRRRIDASMAAVIAVQACGSSCDDTARMPGKPVGDGRSSRRRLGSTLRA
jgi:hypothetical protein